MNFDEGNGQDETPLNVLVCPDQPSWAFDNIARNIARFAAPNTISKLYMRDVIGNEHLFFETIFLKRIDLCHIFWREDLFYLLHPSTLQKAAQHFGFDFATMVRSINSCAFTTSVYDHLFSASAQIQERRPGFAVCDGYTVSSEKLRLIYSSEQDISPPDLVMADGVNVDHFSPGEARQRTDGPFALGWVGNSAWGRNTNSSDIKGFNRLFRPLVETLAAQGHAVRPHVADPQLNRIEFEDMPDFYRQLDIFVCTSSMEGTPNPVLEAMATGIPIVSSDVGIVPEVFGELQSRFIIRNPTPENFANAVAELIQNEQLRLTIGEENRSRALGWSWEMKTKDWWPFWKKVVRRSMDPRYAARRELYLCSLENDL